jgi:hypothetical protein
MQGFLGAFSKFRLATISFAMSECRFVRPSAWNNSVYTGRIFMKFCISMFSENLSTELKFHENLTKIAVLPVAVCTFMDISN